MNPLPLPDHHVHVLGWTFIHFLWKGTVVAVGLSLTNAVIGHWRVRVRYGASCAAMVVLVALPILTAWTGFRSLPVDPRQLSPVLLFETTTLLEPPLTSLRSAIDSGTLFSAPVWVNAVTGSLPWLVHLWIAGTAVLLLRVAGDGVACILPVATASPWLRANGMRCFARSLHAWPSECRFDLPNQRIQPFPWSSVGFGRSSSCPSACSSGCHRTTSKPSSPTSWRTSAGTTVWSTCFRSWQSPFSFFTPPFGGYRAASGSKENSAATTPSLTSVARPRSTRGPYRCLASTAMRSWR